MKIEKKILFYIFLVPIMGLMIGIIGGIYLMNYSNTLSIQEGKKFLEQREIKLQKEKLKTIVHAAINIIKTNSNNIHIINKICSNKKDVYIFIYKVNNINGGKNFATMLLNPNRPDLVGKQIDDDYTDIKGFAFRKEMLKQIRQKGEAFVTYYYKKPNANKIIQKISYFKYYKPLNIIIASGVYLDDISNIISHYENHLHKVNYNIIQKFLIISAFVFLFTIFFTFIISKYILKEFKKYRNTILLNEKKLRYKLYLDELTKLKSRKALVEDIEKEKFKCLVLIDIDNFRNVNQFYGADVGDKYLIKFGELLKQFKKEIKESMILYRIGSDEFVLGIINSNYEKANNIIQKLHTFLNTHKIEIENEFFDCDATIVFSNFPEPLKKSLLALTEAKNTNKSILHYKDISAKQKEKEFLETKKMLKTAIKKEQIIPYAQPIVNSNKEIIKYELLMRIVTEDKVIPPYFLEDAKRAKLYPQLSSIMIDKCFEFIENTDVLCSINIDMLDLIDDNIINKLRTYTKKIQKPVVFEILESESFKNYDIIKQFIEEFRQYGVLFAIDDFGSGYSNYNEIIALKPDYLKIDGSLIKNITISKENLIIIDSILFITNMINIKTTAEFVENEAIFNKLKALGVNEFQGYYFDKPKPLDEFK